MRVWHFACDGRRNSSSCTHWTAFTSLTVLPWDFEHMCCTVCHMLQFRCVECSCFFAVFCTLTCRLTWLFTSTGHLGITSKHAAPSPSSMLSFSFHLISPSSSRPLFLAQSTPSTRPHSAPLPLIPTKLLFARHLQFLSNQAVFTSLWCFIIRH